MWIKLDDNRYQNVANANGIVIQEEENEQGLRTFALVVTTADYTQLIVLERKETATDTDFETELDNCISGIESLLNGSTKLWDLSNNPDVPRVELPVVQREVKVY